MSDRVSKARITSSGGVQEKFVNEALLLAKCQHPNIVEVYKVFQQDGLWCMVMEYIDGGVNEFN